MMVESVTGCSAPRLQHCSTSRYLVSPPVSTAVLAHFRRTCTSPGATEASDLVVMHVDRTHPTAGPDPPAARGKADHEISHQSDGPGSPARHRGGPVRGRPGARGPGDRHSWPGDPRGSRLPEPRQ